MTSPRRRQIPTPFLQSTDNDFRTTFMTPTPDTRGVPVDATFHYRKFPLMDPANIARCAASGGKGGLSALTQQRAPTSIRHPRPLVSESEFSRLSRSDAASTTAVLASFGCVRRRGMLPPPSLTPLPLAGAAKRSRCHGRSAWPG